MLSQINGCAFCADMRSFDAHKAGESLERLFAVATWREAPFFALTEAASVIEHGQGLATWRYRGSRSNARGRILPRYRWLSRSCSSLLAELAVLAGARLRPGNA
jgi:AhpD family alkylhydroperoxidase